MKKTNLLPALFEKFGRPYSGSLRKRYDRMLNALLESGLFVVELCPIDRVWHKDKKGKIVKSNYRVKMPLANVQYSGYAGHANDAIDPFDILVLVGHILQTEEARKVIPSYVDLDSRCQRCKGQEIPGFIRMFSHVCNGICFECYGSGYNPKFKPVIEIDQKAH
jgi:hypothetical protein